MKLQLALDLLDEYRAVEVVRTAGPYVDIIEVGTSLLKLSGVGIIAKLKAVCPGKPIFVDSKVIDGPEREATLMCAAGADLFSMLACATDEAAAKVLKIARANGRHVVFDLQSVEDYKSRCVRLKELGAAFLCVHKNAACGEDLLSSFQECLDVKQLTGLPIFLAGGITTETLPAIKWELNPECAIIGGALLDAADVAQTAKQFRAIADS